MVKSMATKRSRSSILSKRDTTLTQIGFVSTPFRSVPSDSDESDNEIPSILDKKEIKRPSKRRKVSKTKYATKAADQVDKWEGSASDEVKTDIEKGQNTRARAVNFHEGDAAGSVSPPSRKVGRPKAKNKKEPHSRVKLAVEDSDYDRDEDNNFNASRRRHSRRSRDTQPPATPDMDMTYQVTDDDEDYKPIQAKRNDSSLLLTPAASGGRIQRGRQNASRKQSNTLTQMVREPFKKPNLKLQSQWQPDWESQGVPAYVSPRRTKQDLAKESTLSTQLKSPPASSPGKLSARKDRGDQTPRKGSENVGEVPSSQTPPSIKFSSRRPSRKDAISRSPLKERSVNTGSNLAYLKNLNGKCSTTRADRWTEPIGSLQFSQKDNVCRSPRKVERLHIIPDSEGSQEYKSLERVTFGDLVHQTSPWQAKVPKKVLQRSGTVQDSQCEDADELLLSGLRNDRVSESCDDNNDEVEYNVYILEQHKDNAETYDMTDEETYDPACSALDRDAARAWQYTQIERHDGSDSLSKDGDEARRYNGETTADEATDDDLDLWPDGKSQLIPQSRPNGRGLSCNSIPDDNNAESIHSHSGGSNKGSSDPVKHDVVQSSCDSSKQNQTDESEQQDVIPCSQSELPDQNSYYDISLNQSSPNTVPTQPLSPRGFLQGSTESHQEHHTTFLPEWPETLRSSSPFTRPPWSSPQLPSSTQIHGDHYPADLQLDNLVDFSLPPPPPISSIRGTPIHSSES